MSEKFKLTIDDLEVQSFVTTLDVDIKRKLLGGGETDNRSCTGGRGRLCCNIASANLPEYCEEVTYGGYCAPE